MPNPLEINNVNVATQVTQQAHNVPKTELVAGVPTVDDDGTQGYIKGDRWIDTDTNIGYTCCGITTGAAVWKQTINKNDIILCFGDGSFSYVSTPSSEYVEARCFIFRGTDVLGVPVTVKALCYQSATASSIKIYDKTNANLICELSGFTETGETIKDMGSLSNLPAGEAELEVEIKIDSGSGSCYLKSINLQF